MTRTITPNPLPHRTGRRFLPVLAAFAWAVALHVAVAAGLVGLAGNTPRVESSARGFKLVQVAGPNEAPAATAEPGGPDQGGARAHPPEPDPTDSPAVPEPAPGAAGHSRADRPDNHAPRTKSPRGHLKRKVAAAAASAKEPADHASGADRPAAEPQPDPKPDGAGQSGREAQPAKDRPEPAEKPEKHADTSQGGSSGGDYQPPGIPAGYRSNPPPTYPSRARREGAQGTVILLVRVGPDGHPRHVQVATSSGHGQLDRAAIKAVRKWTFRPAKRGGRTVEGKVKVPVRFRLSGR